LNLILLRTLNDTFDEGETKQNNMVKIIYIQYVVYTTYDSVDFDDPISTTSYFKKLYLLLLGAPELEEQIDEIFEQLTQFFKGKIEKGSKKPIDVEGQHIMKSAAEKIHGNFRDIKPGSFTVGVNFARNVMNEAMVDLMGLYDKIDYEGSLQLNRNTKKG
jgi:hypothetical protein